MFLTTKEVNYLLKKILENAVEIDQLLGALLIKPQNNRNFISNELNTRITSMDTCCYSRIF